MKKFWLLAAISVMWSTAGVSEEQNPVRIESEISGPKNYLFLDQHILALSKHHLEVFSAKGKLKIKEFLLTGMKRMVFSDDRSFTAALFDNDVHIVKSRTRRKIVLPFNDVVDARFSGNNRKVALMGHHELRLFDSDSGQNIHTTSVSDAIVRIGAMSKTGDKIVLISSENQIWLYETDTATVRSIATHNVGITHVALSLCEQYVLSSWKDGTFIKVVLSDNPIEQRINVGPNEILAFVEANGFVYGICSQGALWKVDFLDGTKEYKGAIPFPKGFSERSNTYVTLPIKSAQWGNGVNLVLAFENDEALLFDLSRVFPMESFVFAKENFFESSLHLIRLAFEPFIHLVRARL